MKSPLVVTLFICAFLLFCYGSYVLGQSNQQASDAAQMAATAQIVQQQQERLAKDDAQIAKLSYEAKTNAWEKYFAAEQKLQDQERANGTLIRAYTACYEQKKTIEQAQQIQAAQGTVAALKILALLLR
jgi:Flp pilus assembly protein TadG